MTRASGLLPDDCVIGKKLYLHSVFRFGFFLDIKY